MRILPFAADDPVRHAFLPPTEITFGFEPGTAGGEIASDVTVWEFVVCGEGIIDSVGRWKNQCCCGSVGA